MDSRQAKEILLLYRPDTTDAADPLVAEALEVAKRDPELSAWFEQHCAVAAAIRGKLRSVPVPPGLKRQIILGRAEHERVAALPRIFRNLTAAAAVLILGAIIWANLDIKHEDTFATFRYRMSRKVLEGYFMQTNLTDQAQARQFFQASNAPVDYVISKPLQDLPAIGAAVFKFYDKNVALLCLYDGVATNGATNGVWLFIAAKSTLRDPPPAGKMVYGPVDKLQTVGWTTGDKLYLLAAYGDEQALKKYLE